MSIPHPPHVHTLLAACASSHTQTRSHTAHTCTHARAHLSGWEEGGQSHLQFPVIPSSSGQTPFPEVPGGREEGEVRGQAEEKGILHPREARSLVSGECDRRETESQQRLDGGGVKPPKLNTHLHRTGLLSWGCAHEGPGPHLHPARGHCPRSPAAGCPENPWPCRLQAWAGLD